MYSQQLKSGQGTIFCRDSCAKKTSTIIINSQALTVNNIGLQHFQKHANIIKKIRENKQTCSKLPKKLCNMLCVILQQACSLQFGIT